MALSEQDYARLLENLMDNVTDSIYFKDKDSRFIMVNQACAMKHGWDREAVIGKTDFDTFSKEHAEQAYEDEQQVMQTGEPLRGIEERETWPDGRVTWASSTKMPLRDADGNIIGIFGITRDITKRKQAEMRVRHYAKEMQAIKDEIENDLQMAAQLQQSFFPNAYPEFRKGEGADASSCVEFLHRFTSIRQVSGDYCSILKISEHEVGIMLCDVGGVGIRSALGTALIRGVMQEIIEFAGEPGTYLSRMNDLLIPLLHQEELTLNVAASYLLLDVKTGTVRGVTAGDLMPMILRESQGAEWFFEECSCIGPPLAVEKEVVYQTVERQLSKESSIVMFTDGLYGVKNSAGDLYGLKRLLDSAHSLTGEPLAEIFDGLEGDALAFAWNGSYVDDVCLVGFTLKAYMS